MTEAYNYRAPQYVDFANALQDNEDNDFFDFDLDTGVPLNKESTLVGFDDDEVMTPYQDAEDAASISSAESPKSRRHTNFKRQTLPRRSIFDGIELEPAPEKAHSMKTRLDSITRTPRLELRTRSIVRAMSESPEETQSSQMLQSPGEVPLSPQAMLSPHEDDHFKNGNKRATFRLPSGRKRKHSETSHAANEEPPAKFISMAEHIRKLQKKTPARFHTRPRNDGITKKTFGGPPIPRSITVPHTPALVSHLRSRPVHALTREEEELKEFEEAQKAKFKAMPLKDNHFKSSRVTVVEKKQPTQIKPFNLTEYGPKPKATDEPPVVFKARPVPKGILKGPKIEVLRKKISTPPTRPKPAPRCLSVPAKTVVKPFSFDGRGEDFKAKREKLMKEMEEMSRKAKVFKARPLPPKIKACTESLPKRPKLKEDEVPTEKFKARSPAVLRKTPFIPAKSARMPLEPKPFNLNSETRARERQKFDLVIKQKELELEAQKRQQEEDEARQTAKEIARLRRETVHHARPMPHYRQFEVKPSGAPLTNPHSPSFIQRLRSRKTSATTDELNTTFDIENS